jgi:hypothetical protein
MAKLNWLKQRNGLLQTSLATNAMFGFIKYYSQALKWTIFPDLKYFKFQKPINVLKHIFI